ncbi:hypothetical protein SELMODRAFT_444987 [Selaginella moellendorffii]|uniref:MIR domain-containing protein n=1 Tax=Selaginella moellendorffii TaxID=88036 RepID=D8SEH3_SELML|nr:stromal cell-derived factor 2-like protein [Selaginella moellendorffii]EFJ17205.1 hypothetical protein SELMODRAFT_444987 [Selaginella moellendorffii]|eukprot:XP_002981723.1 stromal cell-derived factor 2-like protein [Selaginella moellendorffii]
MIGLLLLLVIGISAAGASAGAATASQTNAEVTYGSVIKLQHDRTKYRLHSHDVPYGSGSGQQSITCYSGHDSNSYWIVRPKGRSSFRQGDVIADGAVIRLQHMRTRKWLHSHLLQSPISGNLEVSGFGGDDNSDTGDNWKLEIDGKANVWLRDQKVRLLHLDTNGYLHSHDKKYNRIVPGQQEVCGVRKKSSDSLWLAAEGVYYPATKIKASSA